MSKQAAPPEGERETRLDWCQQCCTMHAEGDPCEGPLMATGSERHAWRTIAESPWGRQVYGVLIAPVGDRWRARIMTYPNVLWVVGKCGTMKFVGRTAQQAEDLAIDYVKDHCKRRGYEMLSRQSVPSAETQPVAREQDAETSGSPVVQARQRELRSLEIRFGLDRPEIAARTDNLSESGLFICTRDILPEGTELKLMVTIDGLETPLRGVVQWVREEPEGDRPQGMGVMIQWAHPRFLHYIRQERLEVAELEPFYVPES